MNAPNKITLSRIFLIPLFFYYLLSANVLFSHKIISLLLFLIIALSDFFDGFLARKLNQKTEFGALIDPLADKLLVYSALLVFVQIGKIWAVFVLLIIARDMLVMGVRVWAARNGKIIAASTTGKIKTISQMLAIVFMILDLPFWGIVFAVSIVFCLYSGWEYFMQVDFGEF